MKEGFVMKKNFTYLTDWLITLTIINLVWSFAGGIVLTAIKFIFDEQSHQFLLFWIIGIIIYCTILFIRSYSIGLKMNNKRVPLSLSVPISNLWIGCCVYTGIYIISGCHYVVSPLTHSLSTVFWGNGHDLSAPISLSQHLSIFISQIFLLAAVSFGAYLLAKHKQDSSNDVIRKLREEYKREQGNEEDPIEDALKNGLGVRKRR